MTPAAARAFLALALCTTLNAHADDGPLNALARTQEICVRYPTPQARAECKQKEKATDAALAREQERRQADKAAAGSGTPKKNDLCFTRKSTGEVVCPN